MSQKSILYISSDVLPYSPLNSISKRVSELPKYMQSLGNDVRIFMPRFGTINERRYQLHEVIRLSGMNLSINEIDQPLFIKVASTPYKMQVYFIDNEEYFKRKFTYKDEKGLLFEDNDERALFFAKGVLETIKRLNWTPDVVHIHGWMSAFVPLYLKTYYKNDSVFQNTKIVSSLYNTSFEGSLNKAIFNKIKLDKIKETYLKYLENPCFINLSKLSIDFSDYILKGDELLLPEIESYIKENKSKLLDTYPLEESANLYKECLKESVLDKVS